EVERVQKRIAASGPAYFSTPLTPSTLRPRLWFLRKRFPVTRAADRPFRLGMFVMPIHDPAKPLAHCVDEDLELAVRCDELGFDEFWVGEHHSSTVENIVMPEIFIAKALALTRRIRLGPAPVCLQYHHPVHVANRLAFLDHLSHGRLNVCFGPGAILTDMEVYGVHAQDTSSRFGDAAVI